MSLEKNFLSVFSKSKEVYDSLVDEQSKRLFGYRMLYNLTSDVNYVLDMADLLSDFEPQEIESFREIYNQYKKVSDSFPDRKLIIYGAGRWGKNIRELMNDLNWYSFCDKDASKYEGTYCGLPVISPKQLKDEHLMDYVVIGTRDYHDEVYQELVSMGFPNDQILSGDIDFRVEVLLEQQYFDLPNLKPKVNEVFIDAGCFNFDTSLQFQKWCNGKYEKIYAFEPDPMNYEVCKVAINQSDSKNVELINAGVSSKNESLFFNSEGDSSSSFAQNGSIEIKVMSIDEVLKGQQVSFIKMDVEGFELEALKGARNSILNHRPRLAICIYHKPEDILEIPLFLKSLVPDYKFYIRHYSNYTIETVLYAV